MIALRLDRVLALAAFAALAPAALAGDWPQFRGPHRDGVAPDPGPIARWDQTPPSVAWRRPIGSGFSGVAVDGDRAFTMEADGGREWVVGFDPATGANRWRTAIGTTFPSDFGDGPRATPTVDGDRVFAVSADMQLATLDAADGRVLWKVDLRDGLGGPQPRFGYGSSPLIEGELLLVEVGSAPPPAAEGSPPDAAPGPAPPTAVVAFDKRTGEPRWKALGGPAGYPSPLPIEVDGVRQLVFFRREGPEAVALDLEGRVLWRHPGAPTALTTPVALPGDRLFVASIDDDFGGKMLRIRHDGAGWAVDELWHNRLMRNHFNGSVAVGGALYGFDNSTLRCLDLETGEIRWARRGFGKGSLVAAGELLFVLGDDGTVAQVEASPAGYRELGRVQATEGKAWTPASLAGGRLFVRDLDELVAVDLRGPAAPAAVVDAAAEAVIERYLAARGGAERWRALRALETRGRIATFSVRSPFLLKQARPDLFRLEHQRLGQAVTYAADAGGPWWIYPAYGIETATRVDDLRYVIQISRLARFEPLLLDAAAKGIRVTLLGRGEIDGTPTVDLEVILPGAPDDTPAIAMHRREVWHLDAESHLEVAIDTTVTDLSQGLNDEQARKPQRTFFSDFRRVDGLVLPFQVDVEFGARVETTWVDEVIVDPPLGAADFAMPAPPPAPATAEPSPSGG